MQESSGSNIGLEAIIRKALMGKYDEQWEDRSALNTNAFNPLNANASLPSAISITAADGRNDDMRSLPGLLLLFISYFWAFLMSLNFLILLPPWCSFSIQTCQSLVTVQTIKHCLPYFLWYFLYSTVCFLLWGKSK